MSGKRRRSKSRGRSSSRERKDKRRRSRTVSSEPLQAGQRTAQGRIVPPPPAVPAVPKPMGGPPPGGYPRGTVAFPPPPTGAQPPPAVRPEPPASPVEPPMVGGRTISIPAPVFSVPIPRAPRYRSKAEARQAAANQGRGRNEHGSVAPVSGVGILPEQFRDLPPQDTESSVHAPTGPQVIAPTHAASSDVHGRAVPPPASSGPPNIPQENPKQAERRRRAQMWAATPEREAREVRDYGGATRAMAELESASDAGGDTPDPFGGYTPDRGHPYGGASPAVPDLGLGSVQGDTSVSRSRGASPEPFAAMVRRAVGLPGSRSRSRETEATEATETGEETDTSVLDLTRDSSQERELARGMDVLRDVPDAREPERVDLTEPVPRVDLTEEPPVWEPSQGHGSSEDSPDDSSEDVELLSGPPLRIRGGTGDKTPPPRRSGRERKRPAQFGTQTGGTPDQNRPPDYSGQTEGHSGRAAIPVDEMFRQALGSPSLPGRAPVRGRAAVNWTPVHTDPRHQARAEQRRRAQVQVAHRVTPDLAGLPSPPPPSPGIPPARPVVLPPAMVAKAKAKGEKLPSREGPDENFSFHVNPANGYKVWENAVGKYTKRPDGHQTFRNAEGMRKLKFTYNAGTKRWMRHPFEQARKDALAARSAHHIPPKQMSGVPVFEAVIDAPPPDVRIAGVIPTPDYYSTRQPAATTATVTRRAEWEEQRMRGLATHDPRAGHHHRRGARGSRTFSADQTARRERLRGPSAYRDPNPGVATDEQKAAHNAWLRAEHRAMSRSRSPPRAESPDLTEYLRSRSYSPGREHYRHRHRSPGGSYSTYERGRWISTSPASVSGSLMGRMAVGQRSRTRSRSHGNIRALSEHRSPSPVSGLSGSFAAASLVAGRSDPRTPRASRSRSATVGYGSEEGEIPEGPDPLDIYDPDADAFADTIPEEDAHGAGESDWSQSDESLEIPEDAWMEAPLGPVARRRILGPVARRRPPVPGAPRMQRYGRRRVATRTSVGTAVNRVHGPFRGSLSTMPKLSWQHLAPGHYIAKARQGMTPGIRQHILKLLNRAKGYIWVNGKRMGITRARAHLLKLLATRASVDIKLTNDFPFP